MGAMLRTKRMRWPRCSVAFTTGAGRERVSADDIVSMCKRRGLLQPGSELYGGFAGTFDYGPLGAQLKKNVRDLWWRSFVEHRKECVGFDYSVVMNPKVWEATGHVENFADPLAECRKCHSRVRADHILETRLDAEIVAGMSLSEATTAMQEHDVACPVCGAKDFGPV